MFKLITTHPNDYCPVGNIASILRITAAVDSEFVDFYIQEYKQQDPLILKLLHLQSDICPAYFVKSFLIKIFYAMLSCRITSVATRYHVGVLKTRI
jgi:hypothetical protein